MNLQTTGGLAALTCAGTYLSGFAFLVTLLAPLGFGTSQIDINAAVAFTAENPGLMIMFNTVIYIVNALALAVLVMALDARLRGATPNFSSLTRGFGMVWVTLVLAAGMVANVAVERVAVLPPDAAVSLWQTLHAVELGFGGGNEIAGGVWITCICLTGWRGNGLAKPVCALGLLAGGAGIVTLIPALGDVAGAVFGLGAIAWFLAVALVFLWPGRKGPVPA
ncbi:hypothetical protein [Gymnodinialimonas sp. 57CJ19]|uniref:hypothetical protein n=1 Tax=Gymnodinialimonas sp. 57CJ19 TaxID=3138498 RepID=UPI0031345169